ncbi:MAG TPA: FmdB family zinc ribbon protein [Mycobacteriales bacterium]|nr:FmdB family zinc ribbon protein [Mycobacteriales bacterium]
MPTYQYACQACDEQFEVVQSFSDDSLTQHEPGCGGPVRKVFGSVGVVFKGSGFYRTDSRSGSTTSDAAAAGGKTESKPTSESSATKAESSSSKAASASAKKAEPSAGSSSSSAGKTAAA